MTEEENRSEANLIPLCHKHSSEVDEHLQRFSVDLLHQWKVQQKQERRNGWQLSDDEVAQVVQGSTTTTSIAGSTLSSNVGGYGQGGPGGPAFGSGAVGGSGGRGGDVTTGAGTFESGEYQIVVGRGGKPGRPGGQSRIVQVAGEFTGVQGVWAEALLLCDYASVRDGLAFIGGGAWRSFTLRGVPGVIHGYLVAVLRIHESCDYPLEESLRLELVDPNGTTSLEIPIEITFSDAPPSPRRHTIAQHFHSETSTPGEWTARLTLDGDELAIADFEVLAPT